MKKVFSNINQKQNVIHIVRRGKRAPRFFINYAEIYLPEDISFEKQHMDVTQPWDNMREYADLGITLFKLSTFVQNKNIKTVNSTPRKRKRNA